MLEGKNMSTNDSDSLNQQRQRRKRVNRLKRIIVSSIAIWMLVSFIAIIVLIVQVVDLKKRVSKLEDSIEQSAVVRTEDLTSDLNTEDAFSNLVTGIDTPDNMAGPGDAHQVYLTFDGSPSDNTIRILDVLKAHQIKATFFVTGSETEENKQIYKRIVDDGHTLGMRSFSNVYSKIYADTDAFTKDFERIQNYIRDMTGTTSVYYRFPGGSGNKLSNVNMAEFAQILKERDITYFDWNVSAGDAASDYSVEDVSTNVLTGVKQYKTSVVLLHDGEDKGTTVDALETIINQLKADGDEILPINENTKKIQYLKVESIE